MDSAQIKTEVWTPKSPEFELGPAITEAINEINAQDPNKLIEGLEEKIQKSENGIRFAVLDGNRPDEYSHTDALVMFNPFANAATDNMLVRAEFIRLVAKHEDVRDDSGKLKPVVMLASPGLGGSKVRLSREEIDEVVAGELGPVARDMLHAVSELEVGRVALLGFSQGADMAIAGARHGYSANLDTNSVAIGDPAGIAERGAMSLGLDFMKSGGMKEVVQANGIDAQKIALGFGYGNQDFMLGFVPSALFSRTNHYIWQALGNNSFERHIQQILDEGKVRKLVIGYGNESAIAQPAKIEPIISSFDTDQPISVTSIKGESARHTWGDNLALLAKLYMRAVV